LPNSIGIYEKRGMQIYDDKSPLFPRFENVNGNADFNEGDVNGIGIIKCQANSSMKCFATCNGQLLGHKKNTF